MYTIIVFINTVVVPKLCKTFVLRTSAWGCLCQNFPDVHRMCNTFEKSTTRNIIKSLIVQKKKPENLNKASKRTIPRRPPSLPSSSSSSSSLSSSFVPCWNFICRRMICLSLSTSLRLISSSLVRMPCPTKSRCFAISPLYQPNIQQVSHSHWNFPQRFYRATLY